MQGTLRGRVSARNDRRGLRTPTQGESALGKLREVGGGTS